MSGPYSGGSQLPVAARCCDARRINPAAAEKLSRNVTCITLGFDYYD